MGNHAILAGLFPLDAPGVEPTLSGRIHGLSGMNFLLIVPAVLILELRGSGNGSPTRPRPASYWLAWLLLLAAIALFVFNGPLYSLGLGGAIQRLYWIALVLWLFLKAAYSRSAIQVRTE